VTGLVTIYTAVVLLLNSVAANEPGNAGVPFSIVDGNIVIKVLVNGAGPLNFLLDTGGGGAHTISRAVIDQVPLKQGRATSGYSFSGKFKMQRHGKAVFVLEDGQSHEGLLYSSPRPYDVEDTKSSNSGLPQGVLGSPLFKNHVVEMDFDNNRLFVYEPNQWRAPKGVTRVNVNVGTVSQIARMNVTVNGRRGRFYLDTGAFPAFMSKQSFAQKAKLRDLGENTELYSASERLSADNVSATNIQFGDYQFSNIEGISVNQSNLPVDGIIGLGLLACFHIWYAFPNNEIWIGERQQSELCVLPQNTNSGKLPVPSSR